jgi:hypothetical protein
MTFTTYSPHRISGQGKMSTIKIGFGYKARRGKDTACRAIVTRFAPILDVRQYAFADELRAEVEAAVFDRWMQDRPNEAFDPTSPEPMRHLCQWASVQYDTQAPVSASYPHGKQRALYQWWGTEYRRTMDPDYWVKRLAERIERERPACAVISDLRFFNEFEFCDYRVRMDRPGFEIDDGAHHISEMQLDALPVTRWDGIVTARTAPEVERLAVGEFARVWFTRSA